MLLFSEGVISLFWSLRCLQSQSVPTLLHLLGLIFLNEAQIWQNNELSILRQAMLICVMEQVNYGANNGGTRAFYGALKTRVLEFQVPGIRSCMGKLWSPFVKIAPE